ncbi:MAG: hypothetical protein GC162_03165 [Planctomycetes bacterium]|nr:hypothetical protein [Planctomycetota bacterium]
MWKSLVFVIVVVSTANISIAQLSPAEAQRRLQEAKVTAELPESPEAANERLKREVHDLKRQADALEKQLESLRARILAMGAPAGQAVAPAGPALEGDATVRTLKSLRELSPLVPDSALPDPKNRNNAQAYSIVNCDLVTQHFDAMAQNNLLRLESAFTIASTPSTDRDASGKEFLDRYFVMLLPTDVEYRFSSGSPQVDSYHVKPRDIRIGYVRGIIAADRLPEWRKVRDHDTVTLECEISKVSVNYFRQAGAEVVIDLNIELNNIHIVKHEAKK